MVNFLWEPILSRIAIITRTKNRPLLLRRCFESLLEQTFKEFHWVIVNDNGIRGDVDLIANLARQNDIATQVIHRTESGGVAAAANHGIKESASEFIHIHDDDDSLEKDFYLKVVRFLDENKRYKGVVSCTNRIDERIDGDVVHHIGKYPYYRFDGCLFIADFIWKNQYSPISFLYRRDALTEVGLYDEGLPVLEDWDFNLRFLLAHDIGVVSEFLANYHWRVGNTDGSNSQTVTSGSSLHQEYTAVIRNRLLRNDLRDGKSGVGLLMTLGRLHQLNSDALKIVNDRVGAQLLVRRYAKKLLNAVGIKR